MNAGFSADSELAAFLSEVDEARRHIIATLHQTIRAAAPDLAVARSGRFLGYGPFHYKYASGREGDTFAVSIMNGAQAVSVYVMGAADGQYLTESFSERLGKVSVGKSCIRVRRIEHLDLTAFSELVALSRQQLADGRLTQLA